MKKIICLIAVIVSVGLVFTSCCSIIHGTKQEIGVNSNPSGAKVFVNGASMGTTPATLNLDRSGSHKIRIELDGYQPYEMTLTKSVSGWVWGNILFGGLIGLAVDAIDGALYDLNPEQVSGQLMKGEGDTLQVNVIKGAPASGEKIGQLVKTPADKLKELKAIKDQGLITEEEYEAKRKALVEQLK